MLKQSGISSAERKSESKACSFRWLQESEACCTAMLCFQPTGHAANIPMTCRGPAVGRMHPPGNRPWPCIWSRTCQCLGFAMVCLSFHLSRTRRATTHQKLELGDLKKHGAYCSNRANSRVLLSCFARLLLGEFVLQTFCALNAYGVEHACMSCGKVS